MPVGKGEREVPRFSLLQCGADKSPLDPPGGRTPSRFQVAEPLDQHGPSQHVRQPRDRPAVTVRIPERLGELRAHQDGEVGVLGLPVAVAVPVDDDETRVALVFRHDFAMGAHAEGPHAVVEGGGVEYGFHLVELIGEVVRDLVRDFHPDPDVDRQGVDCQPKVTGHALHPGGALPARGQQDRGGGHLGPVRQQDPPGPPLFNQDRLDFRFHPDFAG